VHDLDPGRREALVPLVARDLLDDPRPPRRRGAEVERGRRRHEPSAAARRRSNASCATSISAFEGTQP
jgi:hypothetical protein